MATAIWCVTFLSELQHVQQAAGEDAAKWTPGHCSDVLTRMADGAVLLGHNEDWAPEWADLMYWVVYHPAEGATFTPLGGLVCPQPRQNRDRAPAALPKPSRRQPAASCAAQAEPLSALPCAVAYYGFGAGLPRTALTRLDLT